MSDETTVTDDVDVFPLDYIAARGEVAVRIAKTVTEIDVEKDADVRDELMRLMRAVRLSFKTYPAASEISPIKGGKDE